MNDQIWSWLAGGIGLIGFWLGGRKVWWCWYVNLINQIAWVIFAIITGYYAFLITAAFYTVVFARNAYLWTRDHFKSEEARREEEVQRWLDGFDPDRNAVAYSPLEPYHTPTHKHRYKLFVPLNGNNVYSWECICTDVVFWPKDEFRAMMLPTEPEPIVLRPDEPLQMAVCNGFQNHTHTIKHWACYMSYPHAAHAVTLPPLGAFH